MKWSAWVLTVAACGGGNDNYGGSRLKASLDLTHVTGFAIASSSSPRELAAAPAAPADPSGCVPSTLLALQDNGDMAVTTVTETGMGSEMCTTTMQTEVAIGVFDTARYVVITYDGASPLEHCGTDEPGRVCMECRSVVLRKSDGALFCGRGQPGGDVGINRVRGEGDILYVGGNAGGLGKLDMSTDPPTETTVDDSSQTGDRVNTFEVNSANDALAAGSFGARVFKLNGGLMNISTAMQSFVWLDPTGTDFYYALPHVPPGNGFFTFHLSSGTYAQTLVGSFPSGPAVVGFVLATASQAYTWVNGAGTSSIIDLLPSAAGGVCRDPVLGPRIACTSNATCAGTCVGTTVKTCSGGPNDGNTCADDSGCNFGTCSLGGAHHLLSGVPVVQNAVGTGTQLYLQGTDTAGNGMIVGVDTAAISETACCTTPGCCPNATCCSAPITPSVLLPAGAYTVTAISLSRGGELTFAGLRNSDGARVVGNCVGGTCAVVNATAPVVSALQRIN